MKLNVMKSDRYFFSHRSVSELRLLLSNCYTPCVVQGSNKVLIRNETISRNFETITFTSIFTQKNEKFINIAGPKEKKRGNSNNEILYRRERNFCAAS